MSESSPTPTRAPKTIDAVEPPVGRVIIPPAYRRAGIPADEGSSDSAGEPPASIALIDDMFAAMETSYDLGPRWADSPNSWAKRLLPAQKGRIGEAFFKQICKAANVPTSPRTNSSHDIRCADKPVEVKFGTLHDNAEAAGDVVEWLQIRPSGDFENLALICTCPDHHHLWFVPRDVVLAHALGQHTGKAATETKKLTIDPHNPPSWMGVDIVANLDTLATLTGTPVEQPAAL